MSATDPTPIIGRRIGETNEITAEAIRATGKEMGLTEAQIAETIRAIMQAEKELAEESK